MTNVALQGIGQVIAIAIQFVSKFILNRFHVDGEGEGAVGRVAQKKVFGVGGQEEIDRLVCKVVIAVVIKQAQAAVVVGGGAIGRVKGAVIIPSEETVKTSEPVSASAPV